MADEGVAKAIESEVPAECEAAAAEAKDGCPVGAIEVVLPGSSVGRVKPPASFAEKLAAFFYFIFLW